MNTLLILAIILNTLDASYTCARLHNGARELNPLLPNNCISIVSVKAALFIPIPFLSDKLEKVWLTGLTIGPSIGITISLVRRQK